MSSRVEKKAEARARREAAEREDAARERRQRRLQLLGGALLAAIVVVVAAVLISSSGGGKSNAPATGHVQGAAEVAAEFRGIPEDGLAVGRPDAPVTLIEYGDLKCPVCREFSLGATPTIVQNYVRTGKLRMELRLQTFVGNENDDSLHAAQFALAAAEQNRLWPFAELFYVNQRDETTTYVTPAYLRKLGAKVPGLDVDKALGARTSPAIRQRLAVASNEFQLSGFTGTPSFKLGRTGGKLTAFNPSSYSDPSAFTTAIDGLLKK